ncbi:MAG: hypothetical protein WC390_10310 [Sulfurimonas sp.]|jgi:hypothetical protein
MVDTHYKAPRGKFRVLNFDSFDHTSVVIGTYKSKEKAIQIAQQHSGQMSISYVYDDKGKEIARFGSY